MARSAASAAMLMGTKAPVWKYCVVSPGHLGLAGYEYGDRGRQQRRDGAVTVGAE